MKRNDAERRRLENERVLRRMKNKNDNLSHTDFGAFRWAPRPLVKKDDEAIRRIFGEQETK